MLSRRSLLAAPAILSLASALPATARAPFGGVSPALYRFKIGAAEVTALADGSLALDPTLFPAAKAEPETAARLLAQAGFGAQPRSFVNAYLVNTGDRLVLIDAGTGPGQAFGPDLGRLLRNLAAAGVEPAAVDAVLLTHLHPDHIGWLAPGGQAAFPNAELVVPDTEYAFWTDEGIASRAPAEAKPFFDAAGAAVKPYAARTRRIQSGEAVPGITPVAAPGHTPGHTAYRIASGSEQLLVWGDVVHVAAFQFERPDWGIAFDSDMAQAAQTRRRMFDMAVSDRLLVAGMHLPFPGVGTVTRRGDSFAFAPQPWPA